MVTWRPGAHPALALPTAFRDSGLIERAVSGGSSMTNRVRVKRIFTVGITAFAASATTLQGQQRFDVVIRGGHVLDGSGNPWFKGDVGISDGRITAVGNLAGASAARVIDATGRIVSPGFIDLHSHADDGGDRD